MAAFLFYIYIFVLLTNLFITQKNLNRCLYKSKLLRAKKI